MQTSKPNTMSIADYFSTVSIGVDSTTCNRLIREMSKVLIFISN